MIVGVVTYKKFKRKKVLFPNLNSYRYSWLFRLKRAIRVVVVLQWLSVPTYSSLSVEGVIAFIFGCPKKDFDPGGKRWDPAVELDWRGRRY